MSFDFNRDKGKRKLAIFSLIMLAAFLLSLPFIVQAKVINLGASSSDIIYIKGNVGIGTTTPAHQLDIEGGLRVTDSAFFNGSTFIQDSNGAVNSWWGWYAWDKEFQFNKRSSTNTFVNNIFTANWDTSNFILVPTVGRVGIGTSSPDSKLHLIPGATPGFINAGTTQLSSLGGSGNVIVMADNAGGLYATSSAAIIPVIPDQLWSGTKNGNIWNGDAGVGNVGIGTTNPAYKLDVNGVSIFRDYALFSSVGRITWDTPGFIIRADSTNKLNLGGGGRNSDLVIDTIGNVGVGITNPGVKLEVARSAREGTLSGASTLDVVGTAIAARTDTTVQDILRLHQPNTASTDSKGSTFAIGLSFPDDPGNNYPRTRVDFKTTGRTTDDADAGNTIMSLSDRGFVGIGNTNPSSTLHIIGATGLINTGVTQFSMLGGGGNKIVMADVSGTLYGGGSVIDGIGSSNYVAKWLDADTLTTGVIYDNGNVGIGNTAPAYKLDVSGDIRATGKIITSRLGHAGTYNSAEVQGIWSIGDAYQINTSLDTFGNLYGIGYAYNQNGGSPFASDHQIVFTNAGSITSAIGLTTGRAYFSGNVGVGTTNPSAKLDVRGHLNVSDSTFTNPGSWGSTIYLDNANHSRILINERSSGTQVSLWAHTGGNARVGTVSNHNFHIITNGSDRISILNNGNVGIGTTNPSTRLETKGINLGANTAGSVVRASVTDGVGSANFGYGFYIDNVSYDLAQILASYTTSAGGGTGNLSFNTRSGGVLDTKMTILGGGNVGVGITNPGALLQINPVAITGLMSGGPTQLTALGGSGNVLVMADNTGTLYGDSTSAFAKKYYLTPFGYDGTVHYYWNKIAHLDSAYAQLHITAVAQQNTDGNYGATINEITVTMHGAMTSARVTNIPVATNRDNNNRILVAVDSNRDVWLYSNLSWAPIFYFTLHNNSYTTIYNTFALQETQPSSSVVSDNESKLITLSTGATIDTQTIGLHNKDNVSYGLGTTNPGYKLDVRGDLAIGAGADSSGLKLRMLDGTTVLRVFDPTNSGNTNSINFGAVGAGGDLRAHGSNILFLSTAGTPEYMRINSSGNVGIGTTAPGAKLEIYDSATTAGDRIVVGSGADNSGEYTGIKFKNSGIDVAALRSHWLGGGNPNQRFGIFVGDNAGNSLTEKISILSNGNVGIGTTEPATPLHIFKYVGNANDATRYTPVNILTIQPSHGEGPYAGFGGRIAFKSQVYYSGILDTGYMGVVLGAGVGSGSTDADMVFATRGASSLSEKMRILGNGNVGIGTAAPGTRLDVNGMIKAGGNYYNIISHNQNGTPTNGVKIKTNIPYTNGSQMPTIIIEGYDYGNASPIGISIVWYVYGGNFVSYRASSWGNVTPPIKLANEGGLVTIHLGWTPYYARFNVRAYEQGMSASASWFNGWSIADEVAGTTNQVTVSYSNTFPGTVNFAGSGIWNTSGNVGIGTTNPGAKLEVYASGVPGLIARSTIQFPDYSASAGITEILNIDPSGTLGQSNLYEASSALHINEGIVFKRTAITQANSPYPVAAGDYIIGITSLTSALTIDLPDCTSAGRSLIVVNETGSTQNITLDPYSTDTILGQATFTFNGPYNSVPLYCSGTAWHIY